MEKLRIIPVRDDRFAIVAFIKQDITKSGIRKDLPVHLQFRSVMLGNTGLFMKFPVLGVKICNGDPATGFEQRIEATCG